MGLFRLFWIPEGPSRPRHHVRYPADDLPGSWPWRRGREAWWWVEDLGTVEHGALALAAEGGTLLPAGWFEHGPGAGAAGRRLPAAALAAATTQTCSTVAGSSRQRPHPPVEIAPPPEGGEGAGQEAQRDSLCRLLEEGRLLEAG